MTNIATTFRLNQDVKNGLTHLSELRHVTLNKLANQALKEFLTRESLLLENELHDTIAELRKYQDNDPDFEQAIARVVEDEVSGCEDPAEGQMVEQGEATNLVRGLLSA